MHHTRTPAVNRAQEKLMDGEVSAIAWHLRVGGPWRALPGDFPAWRTVYGWFRRWLGLGLFDRLLCDVARLRRRAAGRTPEPSLGIIDTQSVKCIPVRGPRGYDAAKKVLGRKRVALVDADGTWLAIAVVPASTQERDTLPALDAGKAEWPSLRQAILDGPLCANDDETLAPCEFRLGRRRTASWLRPTFIRS